MSQNLDFQYLFEGSLSNVILAEIFLRAHGFQAYAQNQTFDPLAHGFLGSTHVSLFVSREDYRDALEALVFLGVLDGLYYTNAVSVLLGRNLDDLLPANRRDTIQKLTKSLQSEEVSQTIVFMGMLVTLAAVWWTFGVLGFVAGAILTLLGIMLFWNSEKVQGEIRSHLRSDILPQAEVIVELAQRKFCEYAVFLRSFGVLRNWLTDPAMLPGLIVDPYESRIVEAVRYGACIPVIALTDPITAEVPVAGACRFAIQPDTEWPSFVAKILKGASLIVVHLTEMSQGLKSEIEMLQNGGLMSRTIFVAGKMGETGTPAIEEFSALEATNAGARVLTHAVFEQEGLVDFVDAAEEILKIYAELGASARA